MSQVPNSSSTASSRRRSQRVLMQISVRIHGLDAQGKPFDEETDTLAISAHGALVLLNARVTSGSLLMLRNNTTKDEQECTVAFLGPVRGNKCEIGLEFSARRPQFWRVAFPPEDWSPKNPEARSAAQQRRPVAK